MGPERARVNTIAATYALVRRGLDAAAAKRAVELMVECGEARVIAPTVEPGNGLIDDLRAAGLEPERVMAAAE